MSGNYPSKAFGGGDRQNLVTDGLGGTKHETTMSDALKKGEAPAAHAHCYPAATDATKAGESDSVGVTLHLATKGRRNICRREAVLGLVF
jgi:hypothetical protein